MSVWESECVCVGIAYTWMITYARVGWNKWLLDAPSALPSGHYSPGRVARAQCLF